MDRHSLVYCALEISLNKIVYGFNSKSLEIHETVSGILLGHLYIIFELVLIGIIIPKVR